MKRLGLLIVATLLATAGCGSDTPAAPPTTPNVISTTPPASPTSTGPAPSASSPIEFSVDGAGPYQLGATLSQLQAAGSLAGVATGGETCPQNTTATGTGVWSEIHLAFRNDGKLYLLVNRSASIPTPSGAWLGTTLTELKKIYAAVPGEDLKQGSRSAYLVRTLSGRGILFDLDEDKRVVSMAAGDTAYLRSSFVGGTDFC